ncbi:MAG: BTAD domain-containing putative transcriptional regulator [Trueperaceae bacterium]
MAQVKASQAAEVEDANLRADALVLLAAVHYSLGNFATELIALRQAIDLAPSDHHVLAKAWFGLGSLHYRAGRVAEAEQALKCSAALTHEGEPVHAAVLSVLALLPLARGTPRTAIAGLARAVAGNRRVGNRRGEAHACYHLAIALDQAGMHQQALDALAEAEQLARELGLAHLAALVAREMADAHRDIGSGEAPERYRQAIAELEAMGASAGLLHAYHGLAVQLRRENDKEAARRAAEKALEHSESGDPAFVALVRLHLALLSDDQAALRASLAQALSHPHRYYRALALCYAAAGDPVAARRHAKEAMALIQDEGFEHLLREEQTLAAPWLGTPSQRPPPAPDTRLERPPRFRLYLLGDLTLEGPEGSRSRVRPQALRLLAYLAMRRGSTVDPAQLIDALWPDRGNEMRPTMQTLIWLLRRKLHERLVVTHTSGYAFDPDALVWVDVEEFSRSLRGERFEECISLYRGELLPGIEWADLERRHLENRFLHALERLADDRCEAGRSDEGIELYERIVAIDPLAENASRKLVACHQKAGRHDAAQRFRREFAQRLEQELGLSGD